MLVLPNGIDERRVAGRARPTATRATVTLVSVMRFAPRKRPLPLLRMIAQVAPAGARGTSTSGSCSSARAASRRPSGPRSSASGCGARSTCPGRLDHDEIRELFARADVFVAPANLESFGIAALEARCAGLPVVAKAHTGIREFVEHGQEGLLAANDHQFVDQLLALVRDPELRARSPRSTGRRRPAASGPRSCSSRWTPTGRPAELSRGGADRRRVSRREPSTPGPPAVAPQRHVPARVIEPGRRRSRSA